jgi:two-component system nitrogen regulation sensor histidine kinase NtrY
VNSLRLRLTLGVALVALVPLALGMTLLSHRIERTVRAQAAERLDAALGALQQQLAADGARIAGQLQILGRDPSLKRLYLLRPAGDRDLPDFLAERRFLLGLDFLSVVDSSGAFVADAATPSTAARADEDAWRETAARWGAGEREAIEGLGDVALVLGARAPIQYEGARAGSVVGGRALDAALLAQLRRTSGVDLVLRDASGRTVATSFGDSAALPAAPETGVRHVERAGRSYLSRDRPLAIGPATRATITGLVPTAAADQTIAALQWTSVLLGGLGLAIAILLGIVWSSQISRPVERLAAYSDRLARGEWDEPLRLKSVRELETLVSALDRMRTDLKGYRERLVVGERHAAWSLMARKVAHEVKNPLTPIAISVADLRRSYEMQRPDFPAILDQATRTIAEEVESLKQLLNEFSEFGRLPAPRVERCRLEDLMAGVEALYARDIADGRLSVSGARDAQIMADPGQLRQALVNLIKNGLEAIGGAGSPAAEPQGHVTVTTKAEPAALEITVTDTGAGLGAEQREKLFVPGFTTKSHGSGLGLTIVERIVSDHHGTIAVESAPGRGTTFRIRLPLEQPASAAAAAPETRT